MIMIQDPVDATAATASSVDQRATGSVERLENDCAIYLRNVKHEGYTRSVNAAVTWALNNTRATDFWIVNDDVLFVRGLPELPDVPPDAGMIGVLSNKAGYQSIAYTLDDAGDYLYPDEDPDSAAERHDLDVTRRGARLVPVPLVHGFCFRTSRQCLQTVGLLDDRSFVLGYGSDYDLSLRTARAGFTNYVYTGSFVAHIGSVSTGRIVRRIRAIRADHELRRLYGESYQRAKFVTRQRLNRHLANYIHLTRT